MTKKDDVLRLLEQCSPEERREIFNYLRREFTMRGIRGIIAEAAFLVDVLQKLEGWKIVDIVGDAPFDFLIEDAVGRVSIQVKMQRREKGVPLVRGGMFVVETQRTRTGRDAAGGATRPYRFGEFDILAVSLHPSTNDWTNFVYTVGAWLRPRSSDSSLLEVFQPIPEQPNEDWTNSLETCIEWLRSGTNRTIAAS